MKNDNFRELLFLSLDSGVRLFRSKANAQSKPSSCQNLATDVETLPKNSIGTAPTKWQLKLLCRIQVWPRQIRR